MKMIRPQPAAARPRAIAGVRAATPRLTLSAAVLIALAMSSAFLLVLSGFTLAATLTLAGWP
jgi:hypothetical protein